MRKNILLVSSVMITVLLTACGKEDVSTLIDDNTREIETNFDDHTKLGLEEVKSEIDYLIISIKDIYLNAGTKYNLVEDELTDSVYQLMSEELKIYATQKAIDSILFEAAKDFCYGGCDARYFPEPAYGLRFQMDEIDGEISLKYFTPENPLSSAFVETVTLKEDNGIWKLDGYHFSKGKLDLTEKEAEEIVKHYVIDLDHNITFLKKGPDSIDPNRNIYIFQIDGEEKYQLAVYADTGLAYRYEENEEDVSNKTKTENLSNKEYYKQKLDSVEASLTNLEHYYIGGYTNQMLEARYETLKRWDDALNEIYQALQAELPPDEMEKLRKEEIAWIKERDKKAAEAKEPYGNGSGGDLAYISTLFTLTKERCYELLDYFE